MGDMRDDYEDFEKDQGLSLTPILLICFLLVATAATTSLVVPHYGNQKTVTAFKKSPPDLEMIFPDQVGEWTRVKLGSAVLPPENTMGPGEVVTYRAYRNMLGRIVTLVVAYGPPASDSVRLHRPETCYVGQGFAIEWRAPAELAVMAGHVPINRLMTQNASRYEAVSYWLRAGDGYATTAAAHQWINLQQGFGRTADGVLVRLSTIGQSETDFDLHLEFFTTLLAEMAPKDRSLLIVS